MLFRSVSAADVQEVCFYGSGEAEIGTYSMVGKKMEFASDPVEGKEDAVKAAIASDAKGGVGSPGILIILVSKCLFSSSSFFLALSKVYFVFLLRFSYPNDNIS